MGTAVIFVITLASAVAGVIYKFILQPLHIEYLETIVFILVIAALVQFVEMFLKKAMPSLYQELKARKQKDDSEKTHERQPLILVFHLVVYLGEKR